MKQSANNGACVPGVSSCPGMRVAIGQADERAKTGIVQGIFPPFVIGVRCKEGRGAYRVYMFNVCPFCEVRLLAKPKPAPASKRRGKAVRRG